MRTKYFPRIFRRQGSQVASIINGFSTDVINVLAKSNRTITRPMKRCLVIVKISWSWNILVRKVATKEVYNRVYWLACYLSQWSLSQFTKSNQGDNQTIRLRLPGFKLDDYDWSLIRSRYDNIKVCSTGGIPLQISRRILFGFSFKAFESYFFQGRTKFAYLMGKKKCFSLFDVWLNNDVKFLRKTSVRDTKQVLFNFGVTSSFHSKWQLQQQRQHRKSTMIGWNNRVARADTFFV